MSLCAFDVFKVYVCVALHFCKEREWILSQRYEHVIDACHYSAPLLSLEIGWTI